jgi:arginyl-tRNA synthetase
MGVSVSNKDRGEIVELADKMVKYGLARNRNHAFNILIERDLAEVKREVEYWESVYRVIEELKKRGFKLSHGGLNKLLAKERGVD